MIVSIDILSFSNNNTDRNITVSVLNTWMFKYMHVLDTFYHFSEVNIIRKRQNCPMRKIEDCSISIKIILLYLNSALKQHFKRVNVFLTRDIFQQNESKLCTVACSLKWTSVQ